MNELQKIELLQTKLLIERQKATEPKRIDLLNKQLTKIYNYKYILLKNKASL